MKNLISIIFIAQLILFISCKNDKQEKITGGESVSYKSPIGTNEKVIDYNQKGINYSEENKFKKAENAFLKALKIEPENYVVLNNYGLYKTITGEFEESINLMEKSLKLSDSTYFPSAVNLSRTYFFNKEFKKGINIGTYVIDNSDDSEILFQAYVNRIGNYIASKECEIAINEKDKIIKMFNDMPNFDFHFDNIEKLFEKYCGQHRL